MRVLTFSRHFPAKHPKVGQLTYFPELIMAGLADMQIDYQIPDNFILWEWLPYYNCTRPKYHTIRAGNRWNAGDMFSARVWTGAPYRSKQVEFAQIKVKEVIPVTIECDGGVMMVSTDSSLPGYGIMLSLGEVAKNDGLSIEDFRAWFNIHPKAKQQVFTGQIIAWRSGLYTE